MFFLFIVIISFREVLKNALEVYCESPFFNVFQGVFKNLRQINVYCNIKIIFLWRIVSSNVEMTEILNLWLSQFKACPSPLGALFCQIVHVTCVPMMGYFYERSTRGWRICFVLFNVLFSTTFENDNFCFDIRFSDNFSLNCSQQLPAPYKWLIDEIKQK